MKKSIKTIGILALVLVTLFACKKEESKKEETDRYSVAIKVESAKGIQENGIMIGTKAELEAALSKKEGPVYLKKVAAKNNVFIPVGTGVDHDPVDLNELCWREINAYYAENIEQWQQLANQTCTNVLRCITCPNTGLGLFVMYDIAPNSIKCIKEEMAVAQLYSFSKFPYNDNQLESAEVASLLRSK